MKRYNLKLGIIDIALQGVMLFMAVMSALSMFVEREGFVFVMILQFFIGLYQICSGIIGVALGRKWKIPYLIGAFIYIVVLGVSTAIISEMRGGNDFVVGLAIVGGIIVPYMIAIGYFAMSIKTLKEARSEQEYANPREEYADETILDEGLI